MEWAGVFVGGACVGGLAVLAIVVGMCVAAADRGAKQADSGDQARDTIGRVRRSLSDRITNVHNRLNYRCETNNSRWVALNREVKALRERLDAITPETRTNTQEDE